MTQQETPLAPAEKDTLGLIVQAFKVLYVEYFEELKGSSAFRRQQKFHATELAKFCEKDMVRLSGMINQVDASGTCAHADLIGPYADAVELVREMVLTTMSLSQRVNSEGGSAGIPLMREILQCVREGKFQAVPEESI